MQQLAEIMVILGILVGTGLAQNVGARYLIITHDIYYNTVQPIADWKNQKGYKTKVVRLSEIGSDSTQIKEYITNAYYTWDIQPEYVLFVGNKYQVPFPRIQVQYYDVNTDNYYTDVTGDGFNDMLPGRLWVNDTNEAKIVVAKIINYEKTPYVLDSIWFRKGVTIVNEFEQGQPPSDSVYWADARYMHNFMNQAGFVHIDSFSFLYGHTNIDVVNAINDGRTYILYRGLGFGEWLDPFANIYPEQFTNGFKMPIVISATCATIEGIGYEWLSAGTPEDPRGVVGFFGTTTALYEAAEMRSALACGTIERIFSDSMCTLGAAAESGRLRYYEVFDDLLEYHSWQCLGDPEMTVRTTTPRVITVHHDSILFAGLCQFTVIVSCAGTPLRDALVCALAQHDTLFYHYGLTDDYGALYFHDSLHCPGDSVFITVTGRNLLPYQSLLRVGYVGGVHVELNSFSLSDTAGGNSDGIANPGENIEIPCWLKNWGDTTAFSINSINQLTEVDSFLILADTIKYFGNIESLDSAFTTYDGYNVYIAPQCPDLHQCHLQLLISDSSNASWLSDYLFIVHAPVIELIEHYYPNHLKYTQAGDTSDLFIKLQNVGSYQAENAMCAVSCSDSHFIIIDSLSTLGTIMPGDTCSNQSDPFVITTLENTPLCYPVVLNIVLHAGVYVDTFYRTVYVGQKDFLVWDPDLNHTSGPIIKAIIDSLGFYGDYCPDYPAGLISIYKSLFVCCGMYPNNHIILDTSCAASDIERYLSEQGGCAYLEGGDAWVADPQSNYGYNFCPLFGIAPVSNTIGYFPGVTGCSNTFTQGMSFDYTGEATMVDRIAAASGSSLIFRNTHNNNECGVANNHHTIGLSFECSGLVDSSPPSTRSALIDSIMRYFNISASGLNEYHYANASLQMFTIAPNPSLRKARLIIQGLIDPDTWHVNIYDAAGRKIKDVSIPSVTGPIAYITWDGTDNQGRNVPQGIYFARALYLQRHLKTVKIVFLR